MPAHRVGRNNHCAVGPGVQRGGAQVERDCEAATTGFRPALMQRGHVCCALCNIVCLFLASIGTRTDAAVMTLGGHRRRRMPCGVAWGDSSSPAKHAVRIRAAPGADRHRLQHTVQAGQTGGQEATDVDSVSSHPRLTSAPKTAVDVATLTSPEICQPRPAIRNVCTARARGSHLTQQGRARDVVSCGCPRYPAHGEERAHIHERHTRVLCSARALIGDFWLAQHDGTGGPNCLLWAVDTRDEPLSPEPGLLAENCWRVPVADRLVRNLHESQRRSYVRT